jgi:hypothetical protein
MTKEGFTHIIAPRSLHNKLKTLAQQNNMSISQLINQLISISINVSLKIGINTTSLNKPNPSLLQALNQQNSQKQTALAKREGMETVGCHQKSLGRDLNPRLPRRCPTRLGYRGIHNPTHRHINVLKDFALTSMKVETNNL